MRLCDECVMARGRGRPLLPPSTTTHHLPPATHHPSPITHHPPPTTHHPPPATHRTPHKEKTLDNNLGCTSNLQYQKSNAQPTEPSHCSFQFVSLMSRKLATIFLRDNNNATIFKYLATTRQATIFRLRDIVALPRKLSRAPSSVNV